MLNLIDVQIKIYVCDLHLKDKKRQKTIKMVNYDQRTNRN